MGKNLENSHSKKIEIIRYHSNKSFGEAGFSLVEILVAVAILGVMSAAMMSFVDYQLNATNYLDDVLEKQSFEREITLLMDDLSVCDESIKGITIDPSEKKETSINEIKSAGKSMFKVNDKIGKLILKHITVSNSTAKAESNGIVNVNFKLERTKKGIGSRSFRAVSVPVLVNTDRNMKVDSCGDANVDSIAAFVHTNYGGSSLVATGLNTPIYFKSKKNTTSGNINVGPSGILIEVPGCYIIDFAARISGVTGLTHDNTDVIRLTWFVKRKGVSKLMKLGWLMSNGFQIMPSGTAGAPVSFAQEKSRLFQLEKGDKIISVVEKNVAAMSMVHNRIMASYVSAGCN